MEVLDIDVGGGRRRIERQQEDLSEGHRVKAKGMLRVIPSGRGEKLYFERTFDFDCPRKPTSFYFRIGFTRPSDKDVDCVATVERTDRGTGSVDAILILIILHHGHHEVIEEFYFSEMGPGEIATEITIPCIILHKRARKLYSEHLLVEFGLRVKSCHREQALFRNLASAKGVKDSHDSEDSFPKKQLCMQSSL